MLVLLTDNQRNIIAQTDDPRLCELTYRMASVERLAEARADTSIMAHEKQLVQQAADDVVFQAECYLDATKIVNGEPLGENE